MREINLETWYRKEYFNYFKDWTYPHLCLTANVDMTAYYPYVKKNNFSVNLAIVYALARSANEIPEFRQRIRGDIVVEHDIVHPSSTILTEKDLFSFCEFKYQKNFPDFAKKAEARVEFIKENRTLEDEPGRDDLIFMTAIPWVSFTNIMHPINLNPIDSFPRIAWGKFFEEDIHLKMPLSVQAHHSLIDGIHMGKFYEKVQEYLYEPEFTLGIG